MAGLGDSPSSPSSPKLDKVVGRDAVAFFRDRKPGCIRPPTEDRRRADGSWVVGTDAEAVGGPALEDSSTG